jgi:RimJ/RimL family protein N-acetyltransferase
MNGPAVLTGTHVRLEPLARLHIAPLVAAAGPDASAYPWSAVPIGMAAMTDYVNTAIAWREAGSALPFAIVRIADGVVLGSSRLFLIERWLWPEEHARARQAGADGAEIGYTWLGPQAMRTAANTEAKLLMLQFAFEEWHLQRVCFHTDVRNQRSRNALARIGARFEGVLRAHRLATDLRARDSARFSILAAEWPGVKEHLRQRLAAHG